MRRAVRLADRAQCRAGRRADRGARGGRPSRSRAGRRRQERLPPSHAGPAACRPGRRADGRTGVRAAARGPRRIAHRAPGRADGLGHRTVRRHPAPAEGGRRTAGARARPGRRPRRARWPAATSTRPGLDYHTDTPTSSRCCASGPAKSGGVSTIVSSVAVHDEIVRTPARPGRADVRGLVARPPVQATARRASSSARSTPLTRRARAVRLLRPRLRPVGAARSART